MKNELLTPTEAADRIRAGAIMSIAGSADLMAQLPKGNWIGGTTVYFMTPDGGQVVTDRLFCTTLPDGASATLRHLPTASLPDLANGYQEGGVTFIVLPAFSQAHGRFAEDGATYSNVFDQPLLGWVSGVHLDDVGQVKPAVFNGATGQKHEDGAVLMHVHLPDGGRPKLDIVNIFEGGSDSALTFQFPEQGFSARKALVNGQEVDFAAYIAEKGIDTRLPLVADYAGAMINVSFQSVDPETGTVKFYAPVFPGVEYKLAVPHADYPSSFSAKAGAAADGLYSCNCILNYVHGGLEGRKTDGFVGPVTFGEVAYVLLNQTLVKLEIAA
jgi:hypothetical protein